MPCEKNIGKEFPIFVLSTPSNYFHPQCTRRWKWGVNTIVRHGNYFRVAIVVLSRIFILRRYDMVLHGENHSNEGDATCWAQVETRMSRSSPTLCKTIQTWIESIVYVRNWTVLAPKTIPLLLTCWMAFLLGYILQTLFSFLPFFPSPRTCTGLLL